MVHILKCLWFGKWLPLQNQEFQYSFSIRIKIGLVYLSQVTFLNCLVGEGIRKKEEGRRKKEEGRRTPPRARAVSFW
ncbi:MAG: hypothetical protein EAZ98_19075 [Oscillatoriales cyanobacterium]|nr:MAG: hypothetical protein EAZ98_19075 [Oscillatoriales cyanobacterium]TAE05277.1 MAG: hypothetical protein EAZ96_06035 [Oscillatoriales cyanobacterium]